MNTSRKILRAWFFFFGLSLFLNFSGIEDHFERGQLQVIKSTDLYCTNGRVTAKPQPSEKAFELALFVSTANLKESHTAKADSGEENKSLSLVVVESNFLRSKQLVSSIFDFSKPSRAPPRA